MSVQFDLLQEGGSLAAERTNAGFNGFFTVFSAVRGFQDKDGRVSSKKTVVISEKDGYVFAKSRVCFFKETAMFFINDLHIFRESFSSFEIIPEKIQ